MGEGLVGGVGLSGVIINRYKLIHRALVLIGVVVIMMVGALLFFLPAAVVAWVVWFLTGSELYAAAAFLLVALLSLTERK